MNDGNGGASYTITFVNDTTGEITARPITVTATSDTKELRRHHRFGSGAFDHRGHARRDGHGCIHADLR